MMKRLLAIPFIFAVVACGPPTEKINDRSGGCQLGKCTSGGQEKPQACNSSSTISSFTGYTFETKEDKSKSGVIYKAKLQFANTNAAFTQHCEKVNGAYASPTIISTFSTNVKGDRLKFND